MREKHIYLTKIMKHKASGKIFKAEAFEDQPEHIFIPNHKVILTGEDGKRKIIKLESLFKGYEEVK